MKRLVRWIFLFLPSFGFLFGQANKPMHYFSVKEGLSNQHVLDISMDDDGFVWVATELGLNRVAGGTIEAFYTKDEDSKYSLGSDEINTLLFDQGLLYIGTRAHGLDVLDTKTGVYTHYRHDPKNPNSLSTDDITDIIKSPDGAIWLSTYHRGIQRFDPSTRTFHHYNRDNIDGFPENNIWSLAAAHDGTLYVGHVSKGLSVFDPQTEHIRTYTTQNTLGRLPHNEITALYVDANERIWVGTKHGLAIYHPRQALWQNVKLQKENPSLAEPEIFDITFVDGVVWVATEGSQLFKLQVKQEHATTPYAVLAVEKQDLHRGADVSVQRIAPDAFGNIWVGLYGAGLGVISHQTPFFNTYPLYRDASKMDFPTVRGIESYDIKSLSLATIGGGVMRISKENGVVLETRNGGTAPFNQNFVCSYTDTNGDQYFGRQQGGVLFFDRQRKMWSDVVFPDHIAQVWSILRDRQGILWFATEQGLYYTTGAGKKIEKLVGSPQSGDYAPRTLSLDHDENLWVGTYGQGIYIYNKHKTLIKQLSSEHTVLDNTINHLFRDRSGNMWIATNKGLFMRHSDRDLDQIDTMNLPKDQGWKYIQAIIEDDNGDIWCSTKAGILRYNRVAKCFFSYDHAFGVPWSGFVAGSVQKDSQGMLYFGVQNGFCSFNPDNIPIHLQASPVKLSRFTVFKPGEDSPQQAKFFSNDMVVELDAMENNFRVELSIMDIAMHGLMEFSYKLEGLDEEWQYVGKEQLIDFRNIPSGKYILRIRSRVQNGSWKEDGQGYSIQIKTPFYLSNVALTFYFLVGATIVASILFFYRKKVRLESQLKLEKMTHAQFEQLQNERLNFFTNITHELRTPLTLIMGPLDDLIQDPHVSPEQRREIGIVQKSANKLFSLVNQLLEFRKVESQHKTLELGEGKMEDVIRDVSTKYIELNAKDKLTIDLQLPEQEQRFWFDADIVALITDNLLSNAYKHTAEGNIVIALRYEYDNLSACWAMLEVIDTGDGIPEDLIGRIFDRYFQVPNNNVIAGTGIGLSMVKDLVAIHHGRIEVSSQLGIGTTFRLRIPLKPVVTSLPKQQAIAPSVSERDEVWVLVVEDDDDLRNYFGNILQKHYNVIEAKDGAEGFAIAQRQIPDLIISDVMMPGMDGFAMAKSLRADPQTSHIPLLFMTAKDTDEDRKTGYELGVDSYLVKPVSASLLLGRIQNMLQRRSELYRYLGQASKVTTGEELAEVVPTESALDILQRENAFIGQLVAAIETRISEDVLEVNTLAEEMNMSHSTLYRKLKAVTGKTINQFIRQVRMDKAAEWLRSGQYNVTEVAFMVGINSAVYFRQCFKEAHGVLPSEYLKKHS